MSINTPKHPESQALKQVFLHNLNRIYFGKLYLNNNLVHLIDLASFNALQLAIQEVWDDVKKQIVRMEEIYRLIAEVPSDKNCNPIKSIVKDEFCLNEAQSIPILTNVDAILYLQLLEHINITSYRMLIIVAKLLSYDNNVQHMLKECFDESIDNDQLFLLIAQEYLTEA
jgi:ferritin-like metal-binding protein YciE